MANRLLCAVGVVGVAALAAVLSGCDEGGASEGNGSTKTQVAEVKEDLSGRIAIDGSSTVWPITDAAAREFKKVQPRVWVRVDLSGSGRGLKKLVEGQIQIADASRSIKPKEVEAAKAKGLGIIELPVAFDGVAVMVDPKNTWVDHLTVAELKRIWEADSQVKQWKDVRPDWPEEAIKPTAPTTESGTFAYFTKAICGKEGCIRSDYFAHEDEHVMAPYITEHVGGIGFFGYGWYQKYSEGLKLVAVQDGPEAKAIAPSVDAIGAGTYTPLSRPLFIYLTDKAAEQPEVAAFVSFYFDHVKTLVEQAGYVPLPAAVYAKVRERFEQRKTGSIFASGLSLEEGMSRLME